jgi:hypothetical protein
VNAQAGELLELPPLSTWFACAVYVAPAVSCCCRLVTDQPNDEAEPVKVDVVRVTMSVPPVPVPA